MASTFARAGIHRMTVLSVRDFDAATARRLAAEGVPAALARALAGTWHRKCRRDQAGAGWIDGAGNPVACERRRSVAGRRDCGRLTPADRCRLRLRWRHRLRGRPAGTARDGRTRRLPGAEPLRIRLWTDARDRRSGRASSTGSARPADHRRQRHRERRRRGRARTSSASRCWSPTITCPAPCCRLPPASSIRTSPAADSRASIWRASA